MSSRNGSTVPYLEEEIAKLKHKLRLERKLRKTADKALQERHNDLLKDKDKLIDELRLSRKLIREINVISGGYISVRMWCKLNDVKADDNQIGEIEAGLRELCEARNISTAEEKTFGDWLPGRLFPAAIITRYMSGALMNIGSV